IRAVTLFVCCGPLLAWAEKPVLLVLGDSLSAAYNIDPARSWPQLLQARLPEYQLVNRSISGATTAQGLALLPDSLKHHKPAIVLLELGANDGLQGKPVGLIEDNLNQLILQAKSQGSQVLLIGIRLPPNLGKRYTESFYALYPRLAQRHQVPWVPFLLERVATDNNLMQADGLHPKAEAQEQVLANIWPHLAPLVVAKDVKAAH
ncbi:MAG TPA: arylesterase, partial [Cellvibrionaceae bacterium]|nr:arylesterase [Cellvibrionaceae bacterium]